MSLYFILFCLLSVIYLLTCRYFRLRRLKHILRTYNIKNLDYLKAQEITLLGITYDFPYTVELSMSFALFKTYGIPTISRLLVKTGELARLDVAGRRAEDTGVLVLEFSLHNLDTDRARIAIARMNYLHSMYKNNISNDDMLYTLSLFILEPIRWVQKYEWRCFDEIEKEARFIFWKEVGERMGIKYIPTTLKELEDWSVDYEKKYMVFSENNKICGEATLNLLLSFYPQWLRSTIRKLLVSLLDERLRLSMDFEHVPYYIKSLVYVLLVVRAFFIRHCALPRIFPADKGQGPNSCKINKHGRFQRTGYIFEPWYVRKTWFNQYCPFIDKRPHTKYKCNGFKVDELGPEKFAGQGIEKMRKDCEKMEKRAID